jgi:hypothetical protein
LFGATVPLSAAPPAVTVPAAPVAASGSTASVVKVSSAPFVVPLGEIATTLKWYVVFGSRAVSVSLTW